MDLELASFEAITAEMSKRFSNVAVIVNNQVGSGIDVLQRLRYSGDPNILLGLVDTLHAEILLNKLENTEDTDDV